MKVNFDIEAVDGVSPVTAHCVNLAIDLNTAQVIDAIRTLLELLSQDQFNKLAKELAAEATE